MDEQPSIIAILAIMVIVVFFAAGDFIMRSSEIIAIVFIILYIVETVIELIMLNDEYGDEGRFLKINTVIDLFRRVPIGYYSFVGIGSLSSYYVNGSSVLDVLDIGVAQLFVVLLAVAINTGINVLSNYLSYIKNENVGYIFSLIITALLYVFRVFSIIMYSE